MRNNVEKFNDELAQMREAGCTGVAFFVTDSNDVTNDELAEEGLEHIGAMRDAIENGNYRLATATDL